MYKFNLSLFLYPYPYQSMTMFFTFSILLILGSIAYGIYWLITWKMNDRVKVVFQNFLLITGILIIVLIFAGITVSLITINHVSKQLGFCYATPETPEGEFFEIQDVVPGKTMDQAGLKPFDLVQMYAVNDLYRLLINNQGKKVIIPVLRNKKKINIRVKVPELNVPFGRVSFLF